MDVFAMVGIVDIVMKLFIVLSLKLLPADVDKLIIYALMGMCWGVTLQAFYFYYCSRHFEECKAKPVLYKAKLKSMTGFATWNFIAAFPIFRSSFNRCKKHIRYGKWCNNSICRKLHDCSCAPDNQVICCGRL